MTRLADALQRANARETQRSPLAVAESPVPVDVPRAPAPLVRAADPRPYSAAPVTLLNLGTGDTPASAWRGNPDVIGKLVGTDGFSAAALEQYRKLAAVLHHAQEVRGIKLVMTASALPGEGKSLTAINLALTLSDSYRRRVLLIDADLRRPTVQRIFGLPPIDGLSDALKLSEDRAMAVTPVSDRLSVLPAGRPDPDPLSGLTSDRMRRLLTQAAGLFDWVVIDTPPVGLLPDASLLASYVDGVLLVVRAGKAPFQLVKRTVDSITHERILGVVMNAVDYAHDRNAGGYYSYYGYGYYGYGPSEKRSRKRKK